MKKTTIYHTVIYMEDCDDNFAFNMPLYINGYIHLVSERRLFGFIPLPNKYETEIRVRDTVGHGDGLSKHYLRRELDAPSLLRLEEKVNIISEKLKIKRKEYLKKKSL